MAETSDKNVSKLPADAKKPPEAANDAFFLILPPASEAALSLSDQADVGTMEGACSTVPLRGMMDCNAPLMTLPLDLAPVMLSSLSLLLL